MTNTSTPYGHFESNRFEVTTDRGTGTVLVEDVLDVAGGWSPASASRRICRDSCPLLRTSATPSALNPGVKTRRFLF